MSKEKHPNPQLVLRESKTVVVVGCSADPYRTSNYAAHYLQKKGIELFP
jgi:predicted CoA-binding protein